MSWHRKNDRHQPTEARFDPVHGDRHDGTAVHAPPAPHAAHEVVSRSTRHVERSATGSKVLARVHRPSLPRRRCEVTR